MFNQISVESTELPSSRTEVPTDPNGTATLKRDKTARLAFNGLCRLCILQYGGRSAIYGGVDTTYAICSTEGVVLSGAHTLLYIPS